MDGLRIVLILLAVLVIIALLAHGLWTIRKNNQQDKEQRQEIERKRRQRDNAGFDDLGVGPVKTATADSKRKEPQVTDTIPDPDAEPKQPSMFFDADNEDSPAKPKADVSRSETDTSAQRETEHKPAAKTEKASPTSAASTKATDSSGEVEQLPMDLPYEDDQQDEEEYPQQEVISLYVSGDIQGASLLQTMTELGLKFGDMNIFERHESPSGHGPVLFRVADMYKPGTFDLDQIENFNTRGVALFMSLPMDHDGHKAFTMMYNAANKIAESMSRAAVLDGNRNPITKQSVQHTYQKIREFERRQKLTSRR